MDIGIIEVIGALGVILTAFLIYIIRKLQKTYGEEEIKEVYTYVVITVKAIEQLAKARGWNGEEKKEAAIKLIKKKGLDVPDVDLDLMIEAAVFELNNIKDSMDKVIIGDMVN